MWHLWCFQGDEADCFFIVESGEVKIMIKSKVSAVLFSITEAIFVLTILFALFPVNLIASLAKRRI